MNGRRLSAFVLLGALLLMAMGSIPFADACGGDCAPDCGDCVGCIPVAVTAAAPTLVADATGAALPIAALEPPSSTPLRQPDHVPLPTIG